MVKLSRLAVKKDAHEDGVWSLAWTPPSASGDSTLLSGSVDETVKAWRVDGDSADGLAAVEEYTGHILGVVSVAASSSGLAATSSLDSVIRVWDLASGQARAIFETPPAETWHLAFPPGDAGARHLANAGGASAGVVLWNLDTKAKDATFAMPPQPEGRDKAGAFVCSLAYSPDGRRLACGTMDGTVGVFDVATATLMHSLKGMFKPVRALAWLPDSWTLACGCDDGMVHLYDGEHGQLIDELTGHAPGWVLSVSAAPSGATLATGGSEATVRLWDVATRTCAQTLKGEHSDLVWACAFSPDGARLATGADDKAIALYAVS